jgi:hypothetical protein
MQVDALIKRLDDEARPSFDFVEETYGLIRAHADEARRHDASALGRLLSAVPVPARPAWQRPWLSRPAISLVLALIAIAILLALAVLGPGRVPPPLRTDHVLFGRGHPGSEGYDLWVVGKDGSDEHLLVAGTNEPSRVSADGARIAAPVHGNLVFTRIYRTDGTAVADLHPDETLNLGVVAWSHDGQWLAAEAWDDGNSDRNGVYLLRADGSELHRLTGPGIPGDFSLDDSQVVLTRQEGVFLVNVDGTSEHQVSALKPVGFASPGFMPDGRSIYAAAQGKLWIIDLASGAAHSLEVSGGDITVPRVSPDGAMFVFTFDAASADSTAIWVMNADGTAARQIADDPSVGEDFADWLP